MYTTSILTLAASFVLAALASTCNQDNCYRALEHYQQTSSSSFCEQYLKTSTKTAPSGIATCGPSRVSSACSCLTTTTPPPITTTTSTFDTSTCTPRSIAACPTAFDPCCAFICGEAQVPFDVCSPNNRTVLAQCSQCTYPTTTKKTTTTPPPITTTTSTFDTSTCTPQSIAACPTAFDPCCAFICAEAQVPFDVCSPNNRTVLAQCSQCTYTTTTKKTTTSPPKTTAKTTTKTTAKTTTKTTAKTTAKTTTPSKTTQKSATTTAPPPLSFSTSTCTGRLLSTAGCPTPYDPCCQYVCAEAQVPFDVCSLTDGSGTFAVCSSCPSPTPT